MKRRLEACETVDSAVQRLINSETKYWHKVILRMSVIKLLVERSLAYRGTSHKLYKHSNGSFLKLI